MMQKIILLSWHHSEEVDALEAVFIKCLKLVYKPNSQFTNKFTLANTYIERNYAADGSSYNNAAQR